MMLFILGVVVGAAVLFGSVVFALLHSWSRT